MSQLFTCPKCGHTATLPDGPPPEASILRCDECGTWIAYGEVMPRMVVQPHTDRRFLSIMFDDVEHKLPHALADQWAAAVQSLANPSRR